MNKKYVSILKWIVVVSIGFWCIVVFTPIDDIFLMLSAQCDTKGQKLIENIRKEDLDAVRLSLKQGANPNCSINTVAVTVRNPPSTPLREAVKKDNIEILNILLAAGANAEITLYYYHPPANETFIELLKKTKLSQQQLDNLLKRYSNHPDVAKALLDRGANINIRSGDDIPPGVRDIAMSTPLYDATYSGDLEAVKHLIANGADPNLYGAFGNTPLGVAASGRYPEVLKVLLDSGADIHKESLCGYSPAVIAAASAYDSPENIQILLSSGINPETRDNRSRDKSTVCSRDSVMQLSGLRLTHEKANHRRQVLQIDDSDYRAKSMKTQSNPKWQIGMPDIQIDGPYNGTLLMWAAFSCDSKTVKYLLDKKVDVNARDDYQSTALMWAHTCHKGKEEIIESLLKAGADPEAKDAGGDTAETYQPCCVK